MNRNEWDAEFDELVRKCGMKDEHLPTVEERNGFFERGFDPVTALERILIIGMLGGRKHVEEKA